MIKTLFFTGALLVAGSAYAGNPSATLPVQIVPAGPGGIACDIGPPYRGSIPAGAQLGGYTHCAANYDFTSTASFTYAGHTYNFSQIPTWLGNCGASAPLWWNIGYGSAANSCSRYSIIADGGVNVLDMTFLPADNAASEATWMQTSSGSGSSEFVFPQGAYAEITMRSTQSTLNAYSGGQDILSFFSWDGEPAAQNGNLIEWDVVEWFASPDGSAGGGCVDWVNRHYPCFDTQTMYSQNSTAAVLSYHSYGQLVTSDGANSMEKCHYVDGIRGFIDGNAGLCSGKFTPATQSDFSLRNYYATGLGNLNPPPGTVLPASQMDMYIKSITFWSCPGWQTGQCNGTVVP